MATMEVNLEKVMTDVRALQAMPQLPGGPGLGKMATLAFDAEKMIAEIKLLKGWVKDGNS